MITEDYCSFEVAKLLKEKGFPQDYDIYHSMIYNEKDYEDEYEVQRMVIETQFIKAGTLSSYPVGVPEPKCYAPTHQMAMKWLREVHNIVIVVIPSMFWGKYNVSIYKKGNDYPIGFDGDSLISFYERACEKAIKYCLENLI